jgi:hypothetical protein
VELSGSRLHGCRRSSQGAEGSAAGYSFAAGGDMRRCGSGRADQSKGGHIGAIGGSHDPGDRAVADHVLLQAKPR